MPELEREQITSGGLVFDSVFLTCTVTASKKADEWIVTLLDIPDAVTPPTFFVDPVLVRVAGGPPQTGTTMQGQVQAILLEELDAELLVEVLGEPVSYGPKLLVPRSLAA